MTEFHVRFFGAIALVALALWRRPNDFDLMFIVCMTAIVLGTCRGCSCGGC